MVVRLERNEREAKRKMKAIGTLPHCQLGREGEGRVG